RTLDRRREGPAPSAGPAGGPRSLPRDRQEGSRFGVQERESLRAPRLSLLARPFRRESEAHVPSRPDGMGSTDDANGVSIWKRLVDRHGAQVGRTDLRLAALRV